jgi:hypothetical protein
MNRRFPEALLFFFPGFLVPLDINVVHPTFPHLALAAGLALLAAWLRFRPVAVAACLLPFVLLPTVGRVVNFTEADSPELRELVTWARATTPKDAVFQFADVRRGLQPGIFRVRASRAIFADWKAGGQVNFLHDFGELWWQRWQMTERPQPLKKYTDMGVDYVVFSTPKAPKGAVPVYSNKSWVVFRTGPSGPTATQDSPRPAARPTDQD